MHPFFDHRLGHRDVMRLGIGAWVSLCAHGVGAVVALVAIVVLDVRGCLPSKHASAMASDEEVTHRPEYEPPEEEVLVELEPPPVLVPLPEIEPPSPVIAEAPKPEPPEQAAPSYRIEGPDPADAEAAAKSAQIAEALAELDTAVLGALGSPDGATSTLGSGVAVEGVLSDGGVPAGLLDAAGGVGIGDASGSGLARAGKGGDLRDLGSAGGGAVRALEVERLVVSVRGMRAEGPLGNPTVRAATLRAARPRIGRCGAEARDGGADIGGRLVLDLTIDELGKASAAVVADRPTEPGTTWRDAALIRCARRAVEAATFPKADASTTARIQLSFR